MDYKNGKIYVIRNHINDLIYIGSTTQSLSKRFSVHKINSNTKKYQLYQTMNDFGRENFYIELLELYPCSCKDELHKREGYYIRKFDSFKNGLNGCIAGRTDKEYYQDNKIQIIEQTKKYYNDNKDKIKDYDKEYYKVNKEEIKEYKKEYYKANKEKIRKKNKEYQKVNKEKLREKFICECGSILTHQSKSKHLKTKKHLKYIENL